VGGGLVSHGQQFAYWKICLSSHYHKIGIAVAVVVGVLGIVAVDNEDYVHYSDIADEVGDTILVVGGGDLGSVEG
jgi:hypothetical protein